MSESIAVVMTHTGCPCGTAAGEWWNSDQGDRSQCELHDSPPRDGALPFLRRWLRIQRSSMQALHPRLRYARSRGRCQMEFPPAVRDQMPMLVGPPIRSPFRRGGLA